MRSDGDNAKRFRPRFSIRTLAIIVTLVCGYAACWGPTKNWGLGQVTRRACREAGFDWAEDVPASRLFIRLFDTSPTIPLVVGVTKPGSRHRHYYFWFFGYVAKLPYERDSPAPSLSDFIKKGPVNGRNPLKVMGNDR